MVPSGRDVVSSGSIVSIDDQRAIVHHSEIVYFDVAMYEAIFHRIIQDVGSKSNDFHLASQWESRSTDFQLTQGKTNTHTVDTLDGTCGIIFSNIVERHRYIL